MSLYVSIGIGLILSVVLIFFRPSPSLSFVAAGGWIVVLRAFSMVVSTASFRLFLTGYSLTSWGEEGFLRFSWWILLFLAVTPQHILWGRLRECLNAAQRSGINNSVILHCVDVYVSLVAEHRNCYFKTWSPGVVRETARFVKHHRIIEDITSRSLGFGSCCNLGLIWRQEWEEWYHFHTSIKYIPTVKPVYSRKPGSDNINKACLPVKLNNWHFVYCLIKLVQQIKHEN